MELLALLLFVLLIPAIAIGAVICIWAALFLMPIILLTLPVVIPLWMLGAMFSGREAAR